MKRLATDVHIQLLKSKKTVAVAESCTGGLLSSLLTRITGSSRYFILGIVAYSNYAKQKILKIPASLIAKRGAVSKETALKMAESVRRLAKTDFGIAVTGIAGPTGGTKERPVGTVFIALSGKNKKICKNFNFKGSRNTIRRKAALKALDYAHIYCH